jgi:hypothetical protein
MSNSDVTPRHSESLCLETLSAAASGNPGAPLRARLASIDHQNVYFADSMTLRGIPGCPVRMPNELSWLNMLR